MTKFINNESHSSSMATLESLESQIKDLKKDVSFICDTLLENKPLSKRAEDGLQAARETPESEYSELE